MSRLYTVIGVTMLMMLCVLLIFTPIPWVVLFLAMLFVCSEPPLVIQIYIPQNCGREYIDDLKERLIKDVPIKLQFKEIHSLTEINANKPVLTVCMNTSRLGTDAKNSIKGLEDVLKSVVLLIFHHNDEPDLPKQPSSRVLVDPELSNLYGIYDVACLTGKGVYPCDMNTKTISDIIKFLHPYNTFRQMCVNMVMGVRSWVWQVCVSMVMRVRSWVWPVCVKVPL